MTKYTKNEGEMPVGSLSLEELNADLKAHLENGNPAAIKEVDTAIKNFPLEVLPPKLRQFIAIAEKTEGIHADFLAAGISFAVSAAIGRTHLLEIKKNSFHTAMIFLCLVGDPTSNKTAALKLALKPIDKRDSNLYKDYKRDIAEYETVREMSKKERIEAGITDITACPVLKKIIIQDITQEAVIKLHEDNQRGLAVYRDEFLGWIKSFNRYSKGGEEEFWLSAWSGGALVKDRTTTSHIRVDDSYIPVAGTIQPDVLDELTKNQRGKNGFVHRLIFVYPAIAEKPDWTLDGLPDHLLEQYHAGIHKLLDLSFAEHYEPHIIVLNEECKRLLIEFFNGDNKAACRQAESKLLRSIYAKFDVYAARICLLLQMMWWAFDDIEKDRVEPIMMKRAIRLTRYFRHNSYRIIDKLENETPFDLLPENKQKVYEALPRVFKVKDGIAIAARFGIKAKTFRRMLEKEKKLFRRLQQGIYEKLY